MQHNDPKQLKSINNEGNTVDSEPLFAKDQAFTRLPGP